MNEFNYFPIVLPTRENQELSLPFQRLDFSCRASKEDKGDNAEFLLWVNRWSSWLLREHHWPCLTQPEKRIQALGTSGLDRLWPYVRTWDWEQVLLIHNPTSLLFGALFSKELGTESQWQHEKKEHSFFSWLCKASSVLGQQHTEHLALAPRSPSVRAVFILACSGTEVSGTPTLSALEDSS